MTKVKFDQSQPVCRIEVEAESPLAADQRPVVFLNADMFPEELRKTPEIRRESREMPSGFSAAVIEG